MDNLFDKWKGIIPKYNEEFRDTLFDTFSKKFATSEKSRVDYGKHFSNHYELYIYAFFLGLYHNEFEPIPEKAKKVDFSYEIQNWGSKGNRLLRKDFTFIQEYIFAALIAKTDFDFLALEKGEVSVDEAVKALRYTLESYTNGGLILLKEQLEKNPNLILKPTAFLDMILEIKPSSGIENNTEELMLQEHPTEPAVKKRKKKE